MSEGNDKDSPMARTRRLAAEAKDRVREGDRDGAIALLDESARVAMTAAAGSIDDFVQAAPHVRLVELGQLHQAAGRPEKAQEQYETALAYLAQRLDQPGMFMVTPLRSLMTLHAEASRGQEAAQCAAAMLAIILGEGGLPKDHPERATLIEEARRVAERFG